MILGFTEINESPLGCSQMTGRKSDAVHVITFWVSPSGTYCSCIYIYLCCTYSNLHCAIVITNYTELFTALGRINCVDALKACGREHAQKDETLQVHQQGRSWTVGGRPLDKFAHETIATNSHFLQERTVGKVNY